MSSTRDSAHTIWLAHRSALAVLAGCAVLIGLSSMAVSQPEGLSSGAPAPVFAYTAVALGVAAITCRQQAISNARRGGPTLWLSIACFALAASIGIVGLALFWVEHAVEPALLYTVAGAILAMRSPPSRPANTRGKETGAPS